MLAARVAGSRPATLLLLLLLLAWSHAALPPGAEDEIVVIEHLPGRRVHLQDFFWTGVEDAPSWLDPQQLLTLYETHTVHHTATVVVPEEPQQTQQPDQPANRPVDCASCIDPTPTILNDVDQNIGVLLGDDPGPRYWLLTVLKAGEDVPPKVELRLARLYKAAFTRQQQRHLGLLLPETPYPRKSFPKRHVALENSSSVPPTSRPWGGQSEQRTSLMRMRPVRIAKTKRTLPELPEEAERETEPVGRNASAEEGPQARLLSPVDVGLVQVRMQNTSSGGQGVGTRLVYTVHLGGKPVPAETAANDMALLSAQEVALELGAPVIIQSEPYLKESRPLALSRKRDAWLLAGAAGAGLLLLGIIVAVLLVATKRKRAQSAVVPPPSQTVIKDEEYETTTPGIDNIVYTSETEARTEGTSGAKRTTPGSLSRTPGSQDTIDADTREISSDNEAEADMRRGQPISKPWDTREFAEGARRGAGGRRVQRANAIDRPRTAESGLERDDGDDAEAARLESLESLEKGFGEAPEDPTGSPHSYLSMPSCKQFPNMRSVQPLSKVLEPVVVKHLDMDQESPEMKMKGYDFTIKGNGNHYFMRASSETKDPGVLGPIVWDLKRKRAMEGDSGGATGQEGSDVEPGRVPHGTVGRARRRLNELLEDSFSLFGSRESRQQQLAHHNHHQQQQQHQQQQRQGYCDRRVSEGQATRLDRFAMLTETRRKSTPVISGAKAASFDNGSRLVQRPIAETGESRARGAWGSRPLSAGPFHRPSLPEVEVARVLADSQLRPTDPAVPLIASIKKQLGRFAYE